MHDQEFGQFVRVQTAHRGFDAVEIFRRGLDEQKDFPGSFHSTLPTVDGDETRDEVGAGSEMLVDERARDALGFLARAGSGENKTDVCGGYNHRCGNRPDWQHHKPRTEKEKAYDSRN